jgi:diguanylate cyclase (GGDEF)-like protein
MKDQLLNQARRVLVIDDNEWIHADFRTILAPEGTPVALADDEAALFGDVRPAAPLVKFDIDCALQGQEGYEKVKAAVAAGKPYHLAFVDMRMPPGWDGVQTIQKLWEADPKLHVVICSAYSAYSWKEIVAKLGASDRLLILKKPFDEFEVFQIANSQTAKWLVTEKAQMQMSELEKLVEARTAELKQTALVDRLTGLPNRDLLNDRLNQLICAARRDPNRKFAVLFLDFDRFKVINDSLGHEIGDLLIKGIADRLREETRRSDTVANLATTARLGGDEFIIVLDQLADLHDAVRVTERLIQSLARPYEIRGHVVHSTASIGITTNAVPYANPDEMIRDADIAMYRAKAAGKACYMLFDQQMHNEAMRRLVLENDMREAIGRGQFVLHYQPIVSLITGKTIGFEALVRWQHPERGMIPPVEFIPLAEEIGTIIPLGRWVLDEACRQLAQWRKDRPEFADISMSVNLSRKQLSAPDLVSSIQDIMLAHKIRPCDIKLEITESAIMTDPEEAIRVLHEIRRTDVELHMDDFGTGYSSLSCLHRFPLGGLKIDRSFVKNMEERKDYALVIDAVISLTDRLNLRLVAEGVETIEQLKLLQGMGCKLVQGYYFAKPLTAKAAEEFVISKVAPAKVPLPRPTAA